MKFCIPSSSSRFLAVLLAVSSVIAFGDTPTMITEAPREIPLAFTADVVVAGGTTMGVAAAVAAAEAGSKVVLVSPRPYLGEDLCSYYRFCFEVEKDPDDPIAAGLLRDSMADRSISFSYTADLPSMDKHIDTDPPSVLADGLWASGFTQSVQYNGDVTITADMKEQTAIREIRIMFFQGPHSFELERVSLFTSSNGTDWSEGPVVPNTFLGKGSFVTEHLCLTIPFAAEARYVKLHFSKTAVAHRLLLGEIQILPALSAGGADNRRRLVTPMQVKRVLDEALIKAGVPFLYSSPVTDVLRDADGQPAGVVIANRAGRQAVFAKTLIDATVRANVARLAGAPFAEYPAGPQTFTRIVVGGEPVVHPRISHRWITLPWSLGGKAPASYGSDGFGTVVCRKNEAMTRSFDRIIEYTLNIDMKDGSFASFAEAEQCARDWTFHPEHMDESEELFQIPPDPVQGESASDAADSAAGPDRLADGVFRPKGVADLLVAGPCAAVSRSMAARMLEPVAAVAVGRRVGAMAATMARTRGNLVDVKLPENAGTYPSMGETCEPLAGLSPRLPPTHFVPAEKRFLPVLGQYDVVVAGGGTAGAPAAIGAARQGARTLVFDYLYGLGGVGTTGLIGIYCAGYRKGFTQEVDKGIEEMGCPSYVVAKMEWWRRQARTAGADVWFGVLGCGALVEDGCVRGVIVATPQGRGVILAGSVVDGTGNADIAAAAGARMRFVESDTVAMQGTGLPQREIGASYINTDWTYVDENDMLDVVSAFIQAKKRYAVAFDLCQLVDTRERRRIVGDLSLDPLDIINKRTFPDTVGMSQGGCLDKHGYTVHPYFMINNWRGGISYTPYRCLLPKGLDGILVVGLALSAHRDAIPSVRMQPCMQNLGYAAGTAAAMAARQNGGRVRKVDIRALQKHLVEEGCLIPEVLMHEDSFPPGRDAIEAAVAALGNEGYGQLGVIMAGGEQVLPVLREACRQASDPEAKLRYAHVLGMMGDPEGAPTLIEKIRQSETFDDENISRYFPCITWLDSYIIALGRSRGGGAIDAILPKLALVRSNGRFSHCRAVCDALETLGDPRAAQPLAELLNSFLKDGTPPRVITEENALAGTLRDRSGQRELVVARTLYRCGDWEGLGRRVLKCYAEDVRGVYSRHALAVLSREPGLPTRPEHWSGD